MSMAKLLIDGCDVESRLLCFYVKKTTCPVQLIVFNPADKGHVSLNPARILPFFSHNAIQIFGVVPVITYIAENFANNALYNEPLKHKINSVLLWAASTLVRCTLSDFVYPQVNSRYSLPDEQNNRLLVDKGQKEVQEQIDTLEKHYFTNDDKFLCGSQVTLADYFVVLILVELDRVKFDLKKFVKVKLWYDGIFKEIQEMSLHI